MRNPDRAWVWLAPLILAAFLGLWLLLTAPGSPIKVSVETEEGGPVRTAPWTLSLDAQTLLPWIGGGFLATSAGLAWLGVRQRRKAAKTPQDQD